ncbi:MAG: glycosyltransferase family 39 protein [Chloroflexota bacterium]
MNPRIILPVLWLAALMAYVLAGIGVTPFHGDESTQIYMSHDYAYTFQQRDLQTVFYAENPASPQEQDLRLLNGTVNKYTIGAAWDAAGLSVDNVNEQWDWGADFIYNVTTGHHPGDVLLPVARVPSALFTAASVLLVFAIGWQIGGAPVAYMASLLYAVNPVILVNGRRAMMEGSMLFGGVLVVYCGVLLVENGFRWRDVILLGGAAGFAVATKHNNVFAVVMVFLACLVAVFLTQRRKDAKTQRRGEAMPPQTNPKNNDNVGGPWGRPYRLIALIFVAGCISLMVFYALNPAWWPNPLAAAGAVIDLRTNLLAVQTEFFGTYESLPAQMAGFWRQAVVCRPMFYEVAGWETYIAEQITVYERSPWSGLRLPVFISAPLMLVGIVALWRQRSPACLIILVWAVGVAMLTTLLTPLEWQRYYLPAVPGLLVLAAHGAVIIAKRALHHFEHLRRQTTDPQAAP